MTDEHLMTADQQALLRAVVDGINTAARPVTATELTTYLAGRITPAPEREDVETVLRILELPAVAFERGEAPGIVLARILDVLESVAEGQEYRPPPSDSDSRY
ncbi:hypothetical protein [Nocardia abscessus]|uniref:hypothetical protein n=1 Tax=Nocardia abscessus TaxID=120957 RepID=UPI0024559155|nr:hypothetical protein [Nocardia abscessus]